VPIGAGESSELEETALGRYLRDCAADAVRRQQGALCAFEAFANHILLRGEPAHIVKGVAERTLADLRRATEFENRGRVTGALVHERQRALHDLLM
jgi:hypothetical protein